MFSTDEKVDFLRRALEQGYFIRFFFIGTSDPAINVRRVQRRVAERGHDVPREKIASRYERCMANLAVVVRWCERVYVYDNSVDDAPPRLCARTVDGWLQRTYGDIPEWVDDAISGLPKHDDFAHRP